MFKFKLKGTGVTPKTVPFNDFLEVGEIIQRALSPLVEADVNIEKTARGLSLIDIEEGSSVYAMHPHTSDMSAAYARLYSAMREDDYSDLPQQSINNLRKLNDFIEKKNYSAMQFSERDEFTQGSIEITKTRLLKIPSDTIVETFTSIYGQLVKIGGAKPTAMLILPNNQTLVCALTEELACKISGNLYKDIGLEGVAYWKMPGWELEKFDVHRASIYDPNRTVKKTFSDIKDIVDGEYDHVDDVNDFIKKLRGE